MDNLKRLQIDNLNFSPYDVRANREGYLTKEQRVYLAEDRRTAYHWIFIASVIFGGFTLFFIMSPYNLTTGMVLAILIASGFGSLIVWQDYTRWKNLKADLRKGDVSTIKGKIKLYRDVIPGRYENQPSAVRYTLLLGTLTVDLSEEAYYAFEDQKPYCIYFLPHSQRFLSVEPDFDNWDNV